MTNFYNWWRKIFTYFFSSLLLIALIVANLGLSIGSSDYNDPVVSGIRGIFAPAYWILSLTMAIMIVGLIKRKSWGLFLLFFVSGMWVFRSVLSISVAGFYGYRTAIEMTGLLFTLANLIIFYKGKAAYLES